MDKQNAVTFRQLSAFFIPLALQSISQGTTHMIVAAVASRGPGGVLNFAGLSQAFKIGFFLSNLGGGLLTAGMVYGTTRESRKLFATINYSFVFLYTALHGLICLPVFSELVFGRIMGLPPAIYEAARVSFVYTLPVQVLFLVRIPALALLFLGKATGRSYLATLVRIALTLALSLVCVKSNMVGLFWAVVCMAVPLAAEAAGLVWFAQPFRKALPAHTGPLPTAREVVSFGFTLSVGRILIALADWTLTAIIARAPDPARNLAAFAVASSLVQPIVFGASRVQELFVAFSDSHRHTIRQFVLLVGIGCGGLILSLLLPPARWWYFVDIQKLPPADLGLITDIVLLFFFAPIVVGIRSYAQGRAATVKRPRTIVSGQAASFLLMIAAGFACLRAGVPGHLIGPLGLLAASVVDAVTVIGLLHLSPVRSRSVHNG